jgi:hypothetical protein
VQIQALCSSWGPAAALWDADALPRLVRLSRRGNVDFNLLNYSGQLGEDLGLL